MKMLQVIRVILIERRDYEPYEPIRPDKWRSYATENLNFASQEETKTYFGISFAFDYLYRKHDVQY